MSPDPEEVRIVNLADLDKVLHKCSSQELLTEIRIGVATTNRDIIAMSASFQELNARFDEHMSQQERDMADFRKIFEKHNEEIVDVTHNCRFPEYWDAIWKRVSELEKDKYERGGSTVWETRLWNIAQAVMIAMVVAVVLYFMKGGAIS
jgi:hypothetical protein